jgi:uncharacterized protein YcbX
MAVIYIILLAALIYPLWLLSRHNRPAPLRQPLQQLIKESQASDANCRIVKVGKSTDRRITQLQIYPDKSCKGLNIQKMKLDKTGPSMDRIWCVVKDGKFVTAREYPKLLAVETHLEFTRTDLEAGTGFYRDGGCLILKHQDKECRVPFPRDTGVNKQVELWGESLQGWDEGEEAAQFFSYILSIPVRLFLQPPSATRPTDSTYTATMWNNYTPEERALHVVPQATFADGFPILLMSQRSMDQIQDWMSPIQISSTRFRPNIMIDGLVAFEEDLFVKLAIRNVEFHGLKPCSRCILPSIDPDNPTGPMLTDLTRTLVKNRRGLIKSKSYVGMNIGISPLCIGQEVSVGDAVEILDWGLSRHANLWEGFSTATDFEGTDVEQVLNMLRQVTLTAK